MTDNGDDKQEIADLRQQLNVLQQMLQNLHSTAKPSVINSVPAPEAFSFDKNEWTAWLTHYERYRITTKLDTADEKVQINSLLLHMGQKVTKILETKKKDEYSFDTYAEAKQFFTGYFVGTTNIIYARAKFNRRNQKEGESAQEYITAIVALGKDCKYGQLEDELVRDRLVVGIRDQKLSESLQLTEKLTLEMTVNKIMQAETIKTENQELREGVHIGAVKNKKPQKQKSSREQRNRPEKKKNRNKCMRCGKEPSHPRTECPANNQKCRKCRLIGHYGSECRTKRINENVQADQSSTDNSDYELYRVIKVNRVQRSSRFRMTLNCGEIKLVFKLDTGAEESVITSKDYEEKLKNHYRLKPTRTVLAGLGQNRCPVLGKIKIPLEIGGRQEVIKAYVADTNENLLGEPALLKLQIVQRLGNEIKMIDQVRLENKRSTKEEILAKWPEVFKGLGKLHNFQHKICVEEGAVSFSIATPRRIPLPLMKQVEKEINKMVTQEVIERVDSPTEWCAPMVVAQKKNGKVRVCADFTQLNQFVRRERYQLPSVDETLAKLREAKLFSKLDFSSGFWQLEITPESRKYTAFITPFGRYMYRRIPFGITSAPEIFQKTLYGIIQELQSDWIHVHADDILVTGRNSQEHNENLDKVLTVVKKHGLTLNKDKCEFNKSETSYLGYVVGAEGIKIDPKSIAAIRDYPAPNNPTEVKRFLGMVNYVAKFISNVAEKTKYLRETIKNSTSFVWTEKHEEEFQNLKETIASAPVLAKYDVDKPTRVAADASAFGIGAVLEQQQNDDNWKPVYFCSKTLSDAEQRYAQIEKEALAATWACERLEQFLIGSRFLVLTDHKPLLVILTTKEINKLSNRLQRLRMRLLKFNYDVQYVPGKTFHVPDALSRAPLHEGDRDGDSALKDQEIYINAVLTELSSSSCSEEVVRKHQEEDQEMQLLKKFVVETWPGKPPTAVTPYFKFRNELKIHNNLICYRDRLVIPRALRKQCLRVLHDGHLGTPKCLEKAKTTVWWPEIRRHLKDMVENCETCIKHRQPVVEPMIPSTVPSRPWKVLGADLAYYNGKNYLVVQDYYSKYPEIRKLKKLTSLETIEYLKDIFSHHGIPEELRSDNGKQFDSLEFRTFAKDYGFRWVSSSPEFQQSNGQAESAVKLLKTILKKNEDPFLGMLAYRNTPLSCGASPAQLLFGRQLRDRVPAISRRLVPKLPNHQAIRREMEAEKQRQKHHYDRRHRTKDNAELKAGDRVWLIHRKEEGMVQTPDETPRSYWVKTPHGQVRRNRQHLQKLPELGENPPRNSEPEIMSSPTNKQPKTPTPPVSARPNRTKKPPGRFKDFVIN
ncbi:hypothetical protein Zmor_021650 [Zophobas morio]|uniref:RNA-directed DNA polymerase n=1 Tax=Zophobas morio TaxID=2755281 RepID=A0AA38I9N6_9CUCU|nr:hypothetical protein Zmor_021650 [Zophobas morio]